MENSRDNEDSNVKSSEEEVLSKIIDVAYVKENENKADTRSKSEIEEEITTAYQKMLKIIDEKLSALRQLNIDPAIVSSLTSQVKNNARTDFFNSVLNSDLDEIDKIVNSVALDSIKPILPDEHDESNPFGVNKDVTKQEKIMSYIANNVQKSNSANLNTQTITENFAISRATVNDKDLKEILGNYNRDDFEGKMRGKEKVVTSILEKVQNDTGISFDNLENDEIALLIEESIAAFANISIDEAGGITAEEQDTIVKNVFYLASYEQEDSTKVAKNLAESFNLDVFGEDGEIDEKKMCELYTKTIYRYYIEQGENIPEEEYYTYKKGKMEAGIMIKHIKDQNIKEKNSNASVVQKATEKGKRQVLIELLRDFGSENIEQQIISAVKGDLQLAKDVCERLIGVKDNLENNIKSNLNTMLATIEQLEQQENLSNSGPNNSENYGFQNNSKVSEESIISEAKFNTFYDLLTTIDQKKLKRDMIETIKGDIKYAVEFHKKFENFVFIDYQKENYQLLEESIEEAKTQMFKGAFEDGTIWSDDFEKTITSLAEVDPDFVGKSMSIYLQENEQGTYDQAKVMRASEILKQVSERQKLSEGKQKSEYQYSPNSREGRDVSGHVLSANDEALDNMKREMPPMFGNTNTQKRNDKSTDDDAR